MHFQFSSHGLKNALRVANMSNKRLPLWIKEQSVCEKDMSLTILKKNISSRLE